MIIRHSLKILEQLSEVEKLIQKLEAYMDANGMLREREGMLVKILNEREANLASRKDSIN